MARLPLLLHRKEGSGGFTHLPTPPKLLWEEAGWISKVPWCCLSPVALFSVLLEAPRPPSGCEILCLLFKKSPLSQESRVTWNDNDPPPQGRTRLLKEHKEETVTSKRKEVTQPTGPRDREPTGPSPASCPWPGCASNEILKAGENESVTPGA